jgi:sporulation protein YlmC with PRC-barrel domain
MAYCPRCGAEVLPDSTFCGKCGMKMSIPPGDRPPLILKLNNFIGKEVYGRDSVMIGHVSNMAFDKTLTTVEKIFVKRGVSGPELWFTPKDIDHIGDSIVLGLTPYQVAFLTAFDEMVESSAFERMKGSATEQALYEASGASKLMSIKEFRFVLLLFLIDEKITKSGYVPKTK